MKPSLHTQKCLCRKQLRRILSRMSAAARRSKSSKIAEKLFKLPAFNKARRLLIYFALPEEVQTLSLIRQFLRDGKEVYAPVTDKKKNAIRVAKVCGLGQCLRRGAYGIREPKGRRNLGKRIPAFDIIIVPGIGFDRKGRRLGRGGGYFDRFLKRTGKALKIGVAFSEQIVRKIPSGSRDIRMDLVVTD